MGFLFLIGLGYLALMGAVAAGLFFLLWRGRDAGAPRVLAGMLLAAGLGLVGLLASVVFVVVSIVFTAGALIERGPIRSVAVVRADALPVEWKLDASLRGAQLDQRFPVHVLVTCRGELDPVRLHEWLEDVSDGEVELVDTRYVTRDGEELLVLDFGVDVTRSELRRFEREFERAVPFDLPAGIRFEIRDS